MYRMLSRCGFLLPAMFGCLLVRAREKITYPTPPEAVRQDGVPRGQLIQGVYRDSRIFPGTERDYWVYLPAQLAGDKPAPLMVFQDGKGYCNDHGGSRAHIVFDNLIHEGRRRGLEADGQTDRRPIIRTAGYAAEAGAVDPVFTHISHTPACLSGRWISLVSETHKM